MRDETPDLSARQMALLLTVYLTEPPHTVRGIAKTLNVSKPAITRALDQLTSLKLIRRQKDEADRRNVLIKRTEQGFVFLWKFSEVIVNAAHDLATGEDASSGEQGEQSFQKESGTSRLVSGDLESRLAAILKGNES